ncbi:MAG: rhomboid family intramembrane serine protease [Egibacteraceae bacterium]
MTANISLPTCYRHPDRETRLSCSSCARPTCVECVHRADVGQKCRDCAAPQGNAEVITADQIRTGARRSAPVAFTLLAVNLVIHAAGMFDASVQQQVFQVGAQVNGLVAQGEWYRLFSAAFLHSPQMLMHILFNMFALYLFGPQLERDAGSLPFAGLYLASALAGGAAFFVANPGGVAVGASGAIFGLFGAWLAASIRNRHTPAGQAGLRQLLVLLGINLALPLFVPGIAWEAHVGGLVAGFAIAVLWFPFARHPRAVILRTLVAMLVGAAALAFVLG